MEPLMGLCCFVLGLAVMLAIVAVVGHGIWLLAASIFGRGASPDEAPNRGSYRRPYRTCVGCGEEFLREDDLCPHCHLDPNSKAADELKDLLAAARTIQRLQDIGSLSAEACEQIYKSIEARQQVLLPNRRPRQVEEAPVARSLSPIEQLEAWFGRDSGQGLGIAAKQQGLAVARSLRSEQLQELSALALVGIARLQASVGLQSRACDAYRALVENHPDDEITQRAAVDAIRLACKVGDWDCADEFAEIMSRTAIAMDGDTELARLIAQVRAREAAPAPVIAASPAYIETPRQVDALPPPVVVEPAPAPTVEVVEPRRSFAEWFAVFMEEKNILWGELIGGTLIVGCSIALVISLWTTIEDIEFFPFLILAAITSALFGAGFYTLHHWKLESTSRGLLLIASLLVPLNFLVLAGLRSDETTHLALYYAAGAAALAVFGWFTYRSSHILIQTPMEAAVPSAALVAIGVLVGAFVQMFAPGLLIRGETNRSLLYVLSLVPAAAQVIVLGWMLLRLREVEHWSLGRFVALLIAMGTVTFACAAPLGFPLFVVEQLTEMRLADVLPPLAPAATLVGVPILIAGILTQQRLAPAADAEADSHGLWRTLGTALGLAGMFIMFGGLALAVEEPAHRWVCGVINIAVLGAVGWGFRVPALHVPAQVYLATLVLLGVGFEPERIVHAPASAFKLTGILAAQVAVSELLSRLRRPVDSACYALGGAVSTVLAILLILPHAEDKPGLVALVVGAASLIWYIADLRWRYAEVTYACSIALAVAIFFGFRDRLDVPLTEQLLWTLLTHGALCLAVSMALRWADVEGTQDFLRIPLQLVSLAAASVAAVVIMVGQVYGPLSWPTSAIGCGGVAFLWLVIALLETSPVLFGGVQVAVGLVWVFGIGGWLTSHDWDWREPYSLQVYALGIGALSFVWEVVRVASRRHERVQTLLAPAWIPIDRSITGGLIIAQYLVALGLVFPIVGRELSFNAEPWRIFPAPWQASGFSLWEWLLLLPLAGVLVIRLAQRDVHTALLGCTILVLTLPLLAAGTWFDATHSGASATRWGLVLVYAVSSILLWNRSRLAATIAEDVPALAIRLLMVSGAIVPVLAITAHVAIVKLAGQAMPGAEAGIFEWMGGSASLLIPLGLLSATLAGHGFCERLAYYLLGAGLLMTSTSIGAFYLALQMQGMPLDQPWVAPLALLIGAGTAWSWAIVWTWIASVLECVEDPSGGSRAGLRESPLWRVQNVTGDLLYGAVLVIAFVWILAGSSEGGRIWTQMAGSHWSWIVYSLMVGNSCFAAWQRRASLPLHLLGVLSLTAVVVIACSVERFWPGESFLAMMLGMALYACVWVWSNLLLDASKPPRWLVFSAKFEETVVYASIAAGLAVWLACGTFVNELRHAVWSANSILLAAAACALIAYQRKTEIWTTFASILAVIASTIFVLHFDRTHPEVWLEVIQVGIGVLGATSLARLGFRPWLSPPDAEPAQLWELPIQIGVAMAGNAVLALAAFLTLVVEPARPGRWLELHGVWSSWFALAPNVIAALWYLGLVRPRAVVHGAAIGGLMLGIALAGAIELLSGADWAAHHVLTSSWTILGLVLMSAAWLGATQTGLGPQFWPAERRQRCAEWLRTWFPEVKARAWVTLCGGYVVALALRAAWVEPGQPYWNIGNSAAVSLLLGMLAIWVRTGFYVYASGLLFNVIGLLIFSAWSSHRFAQAGPMLAQDEWVSYFALAQVLSFGAAAIVWSLIERRLPFGLTAGVPFSQTALTLGIHLLAIGVGLANGLHLLGEDVRIGIALAWLSLGVLAIASLCDLWRPDFSRFTRYQLYTCGLLALGLYLQGVPREDWLRAATLLLAGYVLFIVVLARTSAAQPALRAMLFAESTSEKGSAWFWNVQLASLVLVVGLSFWITLASATLEHRLVGALATLIATVAAFLLVRIWPALYVPEADAESGRADVPCYLVLSLALVTALEACWAFIDPATTSVIWLQRSAATLAVLGLATVAYRMLLPRWIGESMWATTSRAMSAGLFIVTAGMLIGVVGQELATYNADALVRSTPMQKEWVVLAGLAILATAGLTLFLALTKETDAYGIEGERRAFYVYLAELLICALLMHFRLNVPDVIPPEIRRHWYLAVMVIALAGLALSEVLAKKRLPILATPVLRSAVVLAFVPVLAFRAGGLVGLLKPLENVAPGLNPFLKYLESLGDQTIFGIAFLPLESLCWFLLSIFLASLAQMRKSANYGLVAALALNFGVWVLFAHSGATEFMQRPQLWLIPLGLIILVAEFVNRDQLGFWPSMSVRYAGLACIYLSSTIEMFMHGIGRHPVLPVLLTLFAVAGMLLGILFRVRAFLLSGFMALLVVIFAMIWHFAVVGGNAWVWWVSGILLGVVILAMFALFEKHKNDVLRVIDNMKQWQ